MNLASWKTWRYELLLLLLIIAGALFYCSRVNRQFIESTGDNYTYQLFAETVFTSHPFKIDLKFDFYEDWPINYHQSSFPPLYPVFLAIAHLLFGPSMWVNFYATSVIAALCAWPIYLLGRRLWGRRAGLMAALVVLISPALRGTAVQGMSEPLFVFLALWSLYFLLAYWKDERLSNLILAGIFTGLAYLTRATGLVLVLTGIIPLLHQKSRSKPRLWRQRLRDSSIFLGAVLVVTSPWLLRNYLIFGDPLHYVGRFSAGRPLGSLYASLDKTTLGWYLSHTPVWEIISRYLQTASQELGIIYGETGILSLLVLYGIFANYFQAKKYLIFWWYLVGSFLLIMLNPVTQTRHLLNLFPVIELLGVVSLASFYQFQRYNSLADYLRDTIWRRAFLGLFVLGLLLLTYQSYSYYAPADGYSQLYPQIGDWLQKNAPADAVIMGDPAPPLYYYARRPTVMFPRYVTADQLLQIIEKYQVEYLVIYKKSQMSLLPKDYLIAQIFYYKIDQQSSGAFIVRTNVKLDN